MIKQYIVKKKFNFFYDVYDSFTPSSLIINNLKYDNIFIGLTLSFESSHLFKI